MKNKYMAAASLFAVLAIMAGSGVAQAEGIARTEPSRLERLRNLMPQSIEEVRQQLGEEATTAVIWDHTHTHYAVLTYGNGHFVGEAHDLVPHPDHPQEGKQIWGVYGNGKWAAFVDGNGLDNLVYGAYKDVEWRGQDLTLWTLHNFMNDAVAWGLGVGLFSE
ncbi:MAG: hypothetical protein HY369_03750 [Candidatus Aenigmarchaeota archaeon]|nr:hypothetical protein [Candidatus Aenigmarchaeota archaeon]